MVTNDKLWQVILVTDGNNDKPRQVLLVTDDHNNKSWHWSQWQVTDTCHRFQRQLLTLAYWYVSLINVIGHNDKPWHWYLSLVMTTTSLDKFPQCFIFTSCPPDCWPLLFARSRDTCRDKSDKFSCNEHQTCATDYTLQACRIAVGDSAKKYSFKKCLKVRQKLGTRVNLKSQKYFEIWNCENLNGPRSSQDMLNNFCFHV